MVFSRSTGRLAFAALVVSALLPAGARAEWTTYRADAARSGVDSSSAGSLPFTPAWSSQNLGGNIWAEPLVYHGLVIVATEGNQTAGGETPAQVVALNESTGQVAWRANAGMPVLASDLTCGDINPTVGITSTPVIDPATNRVFAVADTVTNGQIVHQLYAFDATSGAAVSGYPVSVEPTGDVAADQLQRAALALDGAEITVGYGGNHGDCGTYHGWLVGASENGGPQHSFQVPSTEAAIWGSGNGPAVDSAGSIFTATGNGDSGTYGDQESVLKFSPTLGTPIDHWAPSNWSSLDSRDLDLGSSGPLLLPGGLVFEIGKQGVGYLLNASNLGGTGAAPAYQASVCASSFGGAAYYGGVIYVACSDGLRALTLNAPAHSFAPLWQGPSAVIGPPIVAGGLVWATDWQGATLYGLNLQTGQVAVRQSTPSMEHFAIPAASDGKLFLATGQTVDAYTIANPAPVTITPATPATPGPPVSVPTSRPTNRCRLTLRSRRVKIHHGARHRRRHARRAAVFGTIALSAKCSQAAKVSLSGRVTEQLRKRSRNGKPKRRTFRLATVHATLKVDKARRLQVRLPGSLVLALERHARESGTFTLTAGATRARVRARLRL